jgi:hypothetical protein
VRRSEQTALLAWKIRTTELHFLSRENERVGDQTRILRRQNSESRSKSVLAVFPVFTFVFIAIEYKRTNIVNYG